MERQSSLSELWHGPSNKEPKHSEDRFSLLTTRLSTESWVEFQANLGAKRASERAAEVERLRRKAERESRKPGGIVDPSTKQQGFNTSRNIGRPKFSIYMAIGNNNHEPESGVGGANVRRDRTAHEKMAVLIAADSKCKGVKNDGEPVRAYWDTLDRGNKRELEERFHGGCVLLYPERSSSPIPASLLRDVFSETASLSHAEVICEGCLRRDGQLITE